MQSDFFCCRRFLCFSAPKPCMLRQAHGKRVFIWLFPSRVPLIHPHLLASTLIRLMQLFHSLKHINRTAFDVRRKLIVGGAHNNGASGQTDNSAERNQCWRLFMRWKSCKIHTHILAILINIKQYNRGKAEANAFRRCLRHEKWKRMTFVYCLGKVFVGTRECFRSR